MPSSMPVGFSGRYFVHMNVSPSSTYLLLHFLLMISFRFSYLYYLNVIYSAIYLCDFHQNWIGGNWTLSGDV